VTPADRWRRIEEICQEALDRAGSERFAFIAACGSRRTRRPTSRRHTRQIEMLRALKRESAVVAAWIA